MSDAVNGSKYAPVPGKIPGRMINLGGQELVLAPLNLDGVREFIELQKNFAGLAQDVDSLSRLVAQSLYLSLRRNYPDITVDNIIGLLDVQNLTSAMDALTEASGFRKGTAGEFAPAPSSIQ